MTAPTLAWRELELRPPLDPGDVVEVLRAVVTWPSSPKLVLEAVGSGGVVSWRAGAEPAVLRRLERLLTTHLPGSRVTTTTRQPVTEVATIRLHGHRDRPLKVAALEPVSTAVLAALASTSRAEELVLQLTVGERLRPRTVSPRLAAEPRRLLRDKHAEHGFAATLRIGARTTSPERARSLVAHLAAALRGVEPAGVALGLRTGSVRAFNQAHNPWCWPLRLSVTEAALLLGWPIGELPLPGLPPRHPVLLPVPDGLPRTGRILGEATTDAGRPVAISTTDSLRHLHLLGPTGVGKSTVLAQLALSDLHAGRGLVVVDPKGDLVRDLLTRMPLARQSDVVVLDPTDAAPVGLNPLTGGDPDLAADTTLSVLHSLYQDAWGPRTQDILHAALLTLARRGDASLVMVPLLLTNPGFRRSIVAAATTADPLGLGTFWAWFEGISEAERQSVVAPLMNKLRPLLLRPGLRAMFGQRAPRFTLSDVFTERRVLLVSLAQGQIGRDGARLLGSLVVSLLWQAAQARVALPQSRRHPVMVMVDEVQEYLRLSGDLGDALAQARGLGVGFALAHQHLGQLPRELRAALLSNARSRVCFALPHEDAQVISRGSELAPEDFTALPAFHAYASLLVDGTPRGWSSLTTRPLPPDTVDATVVRRQSQTRYGRPLSEVEADWANLSAQAPEGPLGRVRRGGSHD